MCISKPLVWHIFRRRFDYLSIKDSHSVVSRMTVKVWCEQIEQMTSKPKLCIPGINLHEKWSFLTNHGHFLWSSLRYDYLLLISNQNDIERCAIPVAYLYTSHKGQKHIDFIWIKVKMIMLVLLSTLTVVIWTFSPGFY